MDLGPVSADVAGRSLVTAFERLHGSRTRFVGWGTGSVFEYFQRTHPLPLEYLVDNDSTRWGDKRHGLRIHSPERLREEDRTNLLVIIYSGAWMEILERAPSLTGVIAMPASALLAGPRELRRLERARELAAAPLGRRPRGSKNAIVVQGPFVSGMTPQVLRAMRAAHDNAFIVLSTWAGTDASHLDHVRDVVDEIVLSDLPTIRGIQNRNCQIVSTAAGIARARDCGAETVLKARTDLAVLAPDVFERGRRLLDSLDSSPARSLRLRGRIVVPSNFTRKFLLYHPSDLVMLGAVEDLTAFWSAPLDLRQGDLSAREWTKLSFTSLAAAGQPAEGYLGTQFCRTVDRSMAGTLADSWAFYRDLFVVVDNDWFDLLWLKNLLLPDAELITGPRQLVSHEFWRRLYSNESCFKRELQEINPDLIRLDDMGGNGRVPLRRKLWHDLTQMNARVLGLLNRPASLVDKTALTFSGTGLSSTLAPPSSANATREARDQSAATT